MKRPKLIITMFVLMSAVFISEQAISKLTNFSTMNRAGDPVGPGVTTQRDCTGCHTGLPAVSGDTVSRVFTFGTGQTEYVPGTVYNVKFKIHSATAVGMSATVLRNDSNTMAGVLTPADTSDTKVYTHTASGRAYLNHRVGTVTANEKEYAFTWTAPAAGTGSVTFYIASLSGNDDMSTDNDTTFVNSYTLTEFVQPVGVAEAINNNAMAAYPNPANDRLNVDFNNTVAGNTTVTLYSIDGKRSIVLLNDNLSVGKQNLSFDLSQVERGIYFIKVSNTGFNSVKKVLVN